MNLIPVWGRVLILPDNVVETDETMAAAARFNFELSAETKNQHQALQVNGKLIKVGGDAFADWKGRIPKEGDRVMYSKYAGHTETIEGVDYNIIADDDIIGVWENQA